MAVLKRIRSRLFAPSGDEVSNELDIQGSAVATSAKPFAAAYYDIRPLTIAQLDECWRLDQQCFVDGEAYSRDTFEYLLSSSESISYRAVLSTGLMVGFIVGLIEPDRTGHVTTVGVAPEYRRRQIANRLMEKVEDGFRRRGVSTVRLEVRSVNSSAQQLYLKLGYSIAQRLPRYYSNGGDGLLMMKALD